MKKWWKADETRFGIVTERAEVQTIWKDQSNGESYGKTKKVKGKSMVSIYIRNNRAGR